MDQNICRICESKIKILINLRNKENSNLIDMLQKIANISFSLNDQLPKFVCEECQQNISAFFKFKCQIEAADLKFRKILKESPEAATKSSNDECKKAMAFNKNVIMQVMVVVPPYEQNEQPSSNTDETNFITKIDYFECYICKKTFETHKSLRIHLNRHRKDTSNPNNICFDCSRQFSCKASLGRHIRDVHEKLKPYKCNICDRTFSQMSGKIQHEMTHTSERLINCSFCNKYFKSLHYLKSHHKHGCSETKKSSQSINVNKKVQKPATNIQYQARYQACEYCGKLIKEQNIKLHLMTHTKEKPYKCNYCDKSFVQKYAQITHTRVHTGEKPYKCDVCDKRFANPCSRTLHLRIHSDVKPHACTICDMKFRCRQHLQSHMIMHTGEKKFVCNFCGKSFGHKGTLTCHIRLHTGETPYQCTVCPKQFIDINGLKRHKKIHQ